MNNGKETMLSVRSLKRFAKSELLERDENGRPIYLHDSKCPSFCDFACRGAFGRYVARDVERLEQLSEPT